MIISFQSLRESHFASLCTWLEKPHVKKWWDKEISYTYSIIEAKYRTYLDGYKIEDGLPKKIQGFVIYDDNHPIGYIQIYNAYDFLRDEPLIHLPSSLGAFDFYIGEESYLHKGFGASILLAFFEHHAKRFSYLFTDPEKENISAIRCYEKAGFIKIRNPYHSQSIWMLKDRENYH